MPEPSWQTSEIKQYQGCQEEENPLRRLCMAWDFWSYPRIREALQNQEYCLYYHPGPESWDGILLVHSGPFSVDIIYIWVLPEFRRKGLALSMIRNLRSQAMDQERLENIFLEVRKSNLAARKLYQRAGMIEVGSRKKYYADGEDALVYSLEIMKPDHPV